MAESSLLRNLGAFAKQRLFTLDLLPDYLRSVIERWNDIFFLSIPTLPFVAWWYLGNPPRWLQLGVFLWVLVVAGYYAWRTEHLKVVSERFKTWISRMCTADGRVFVQLRITNVGPPSSIHTWQGSYRKSDGSHVHWLHEFYVTDEQILQPKEIRGRNLIRDLDMFTTGETREGWVAINIGGASWPELKPIFETFALRFTDAFDNIHVVGTLPGLAQKPRC